MQKCFKVSFTAYLQKISLGLKSQDFQLQVLWKRGEKMAESGKSPLNNGVCLFGKNLTIACNMIYDVNRKEFKEKITKFQVMLYKGEDTRQAGQIQFNVAQYMNQQKLKSKTYEIQLKNCPDKNSKMYFTLKGKLEGQISVDDRSMCSMNSIAITENSTSIDLGSKILRRDSNISHISVSPKKESSVQNISAISKESSTNISNSSKLPAQLIPTSDKEAKKARQKQQTQANPQKQVSNPLDMKIKALQIQNSKMKEQLLQKDKLAKQNQQLKRAISKQQFAKVIELKQKIEKGKKQLEELKTQIKKKAELQKEVKLIEQEIFRSKFQLMTAFNLGFERGGSQLASKLQDLCGYHQK